MKKYLFIFSLVGIISCSKNDERFLTNEQKISGTYLLHSLNIIGNDNEWVTANYDSASIILDNQTWSPPFDEEKFEGNYNNTQKYDSYYKFNQQVSNTVHIGTGVWALNGDSIQIGEYINSYSGGDTLFPITSCVINNYKWNYNDGRLTFIDEYGNETYFLKKD